MKQCPNCKTHDPDNAAFCSSCGTDLRSVSAAPEAPKPGCFCPKCGTAQPAGTAFCSNCGAAIDAPARPKTRPAKKSGSGGKKPLAAIVALILAAAVGIGLIRLVSGLFVSKEKQFINCQLSVLADHAAGPAKVMLDTYGSGRLSTDLTLSASATGSKLVQNILENSSVTLGLDMNAGKNSLLANAQLTLMGSPVASGLVTYSKGTVGFYLPELDKTYYTADLSKLLSTLFDEDIDLSGLSVPSISTKEWLSVLKKYPDILYSAVTKNDLKVEKNEEFRLSRLKSDYKGTVYTFTPSAENIEKMLTELSSQLSRDKELRKLLTELLNEIAAAMGPAAPAADLEDTIDDMLDELADALERSAEDIAEELEKLDFTWKLYMQGKEVRMITFTWEEHNTKYTLGYERDGSESKGLTEIVYLTAKNGSERYDAFTLKNSYTKKGNTCTGKMAFAVAPGESYENGFDFTYEADTGKRSALGIPYGSYELTFPVSRWDYNTWERVTSDETITLTVAKGSKGGTDHVVTIKDVEALFGDFYDIERLEITLNTTDKCTAKEPSGKKVDISKYDKEDLEDLIQDLYFEAMNVFGSVSFDLRDALH